jgi:hypothetical protein
LAFAQGINSRFLTRSKGERIRKDKVLFSGEVKKENFVIYASKKIAYSVCALVFLAFGLVVSHHAYHMQSVAAAPGVSPEMQRLQKFYLGTWQYTETYPKSSFAPNGGQNTGIYTSELGPGGNSLINRFHSQGPVGDFEGLLMMTWDPREKAYKSYIFGNDFPGAVIESGNFEGDTLVFHGGMTIGESKITMRNSSHIDEKGVMTVEEFSALGTAPEALLVRVVATRKPQ